MSVVTEVPPARRGFTLVELLVVIGIIGLLISILLPSLTMVRRSSLRTACGAQLRDIGNAFQMYLSESKGRTPHMLNPVPLQTPPMILNAPTLYQAFDGYLGKNRKDIDNSKNVLKVWICPADQIRDFDKDPALASFQRYADAYGTSYEYNFFMNVWRPFTPFVKVLKDAETTPIGPGLPPLGIIPTKFRVFGDLTTFHGPPGRSGNMNFLFGDWHVGDLEGGEVPAGGLNVKGM